MADSHYAAHDTVKRASLQQEKEVLELELQKKTQKVDLLSKSNGQLATQVQQLKAMIKDAHVRYEGDLQRTVASLQDQYNSALELLQLGSGLVAPSQVKADLAASEHPSAVSLGGTSSAFSSSYCTGAHHPPCTRITQQPTQKEQQQQPRQMCKCRRAAACTCCPHAGPQAYGTKQKQSSRPAGVPDTRLSALGLNADDLAPVAAYGSTVGLNTEPLAVLRDVLNLDGSRDQGREEPLLRNRSFSTGISSAAASSAGSFLAQAQFESRLRNAYRSMLLQLQHRYQLEHERQEDAHKLALQEQEARHDEELRQLATAQDQELDKIARRIERQESVRRAELQRLEAELAAATAAAETSRSQAASARAAAESLQAQLQLQRTTHEAELQHVRQGSLPLEEHEEIVRKSKAEWEQALKQRERDYNALLSELAGLRRQLSSVAEPSASSGHSCGISSTIVSPPAVALGGHNVPAPAMGTVHGPPAQVQLAQNPHTATSIQDAAACRFIPNPHAHQPVGDFQQAREAHQLQKECDQGILQTEYRHRQGQPQFYISHSINGQAQHQHKQPRAEGATSGVSEFLLVTGSGLRVRLNPASISAEAFVNSRPGSPAGRSHSAAAVSVLEQKDDETGSIDLAVAGGDATTPRSHAHWEEEQDLPPPPSSSSSRLSALVNAVVHGSSTTRRGLGDCMAKSENATTAVKAVPALDNDGGIRIPTASGGDACGASNDGEALHVSSGPCHSHHQEQKQRKELHGWYDGDDGVDGINDTSNVGDAGDNPRSPDHHTSEVTLGRWQSQAAHAGPSDEALSWALPAPDTCLHRSGSSDAATAAARRASGTLPRTSARIQRDIHGLGATSAVGRRSPSPSPTSSPHGCSGRVSKSSWGKSGNPVASVVLPRCLRCGLNDATSPGCCRFHPALLSQPGGLRFTPEWMTCQAAGHTARTPGCFVRSEHFYEPPGLQPQPPAADTQAVARSQVGELRPKIARAPSHEGMGVDEPDAANGNCNDKSMLALQMDRRSSGGGGGREPFVARSATLAGVRKSTAAEGPVSAALQRPSATRSPIRQAAEVLGCDRGGIAARSSGGGSDSPSPKPRTRLPSPMKR